mgnify:CR=1 FL=1
MEYTDNSRVNVICHTGKLSVSVNVNVNVNIVCVIFIKKKYILN